MSLNAVAVNFTKRIRIGITTGKPIIAIKVAPLFALLAIAEIKVNVIEKPKLPSASVVIKSGISLTGCPATTPNTPKVNKQSTVKSKKLYIILEIKIADGFASV